MRKKKILITNNREIYEKLNMLHFSPEVLLKNVRKVQLSKMLNSLNKNEVVCELEKVGDYFLIRRKKPLNFDIYLR